MLRLTSAAAHFVRRTQLERGKSDHLLRVRRVSAGDGTKIRLTFVTAAEPGDQVGQSHAIGLCVAGELASTLDHQLLDLKETTAGWGLVLRSTT